jgi:hypothetical protein
MHRNAAYVSVPDLDFSGVEPGAQRQTHLSADEVLVSRVVTDLVAGAGLKFCSRELHELKGLPGALGVVCRKLLRKARESGRIRSLSPSACNLAHSAERPIERPTKFDMLINLKTVEARALIIPCAPITLADQYGMSVGLPRRSHFRDASRRRGHDASKRDEIGSAWKRVEMGEPNAFLGGLARHWSLSQRAKGVILATTWDILSSSFW